MHDQVNRLAKKWLLSTMTGAEDLEHAQGGFSQVGGHGHCTGLPSSQEQEVAAFVEKVLLGMNTNANVAVSAYTTSLTRWIDWQTPTLN
jgi:hypothetical protein